MRHVTSLACVLLACLACVPLQAQRPEFIHPEFLAPPFVVPADAPSRVVVGGKDESGERLVVTGRTLDGTRPVAGVSLFVFHTDAKGRYAAGMNNQEGEMN